MSRLFPFAAMAAALIATPVPAQNPPTFSGELITLAFPQPPTNPIPIYEVHTGPNLILTQGGVTTFSGLSMPGLPPGAAPGTGGIDYDAGRQVMVVVDIAGVLTQEMPHYLSPTPPRFWTPLHPTVMSQLQGSPVGIAVDRANDVWTLASASGRFLDVDPQTLAPVGPVRVSGLTNVVDVDYRMGAPIAVDATGSVHVTDRQTGAVIQTILPPFPLPASATDVAVDDRTGRVFALLADHGVVPLDDARVRTATALRALGLASHAVPVRRTNCNQSRWWNVNGPCVAGNASFRLDLGGVAPGSFVLLAVATGFTPNGVSFGGPGCGLHLLPQTILGTVGTVADPLGTAAFPLPLNYDLGGAAVTTQAGVMGPAVEITDAADFGIATSF